MVSLDKLSCYLLLLLFVLYIGQLGVGLQGMGVYLIGPIVLISFVYLLKCISTGCLNNKISALWLVWLVYNFILYLAKGDLADYGLMRNIILNMLPFFGFYYFATKGILTPNTIKIFFVGLLVVFVLVINESKALLAEDASSIEFANNQTYLILGLLPFAFLFERRLYLLGVLFLFAYFSIDSMKRAVLLVSLFSFGVFALGYHEGRVRNIKSKFKGMIQALVWVLVLSFIGVYYYLSVGIGEKFETRILLSIQEGHSAGRDVLVQRLFDAWLNSDNTFNYIFGLGYNASADLFVSVTHNDLIKALGENGILGLVALCSLLSALFSKFIKNNWSLYEKSAYLMLMFSVFVAVMTSRWYAAPWFFANCVLLPYLLAQATSAKQIALTKGYDSK